MHGEQHDMLENALKSFNCEIEHYDHVFLAELIGGNVVDKNYGLKDKVINFDLSNKSTNSLSATIDMATQAEAEKLANKIKSYKFETENYTFELSKIGGFKIIDKNYGLNNKNKILSVDDDELPMVGAIKTNTVKQLLNND